MYLLSNMAILGIYVKFRRTQGDHHRKDDAKNNPTSLDERNDVNLFCRIFVQKGLFKKDSVQEITILGAWSNVANFVLILS